MCNFADATRAERMDCHSWFASMTALHLDATRAERMDCHGQNGHLLLVSDDATRAERMDCQPSFTVNTLARSRCNSRGTYGLPVVQTAFYLTVSRCNSRGTYGLPVYQTMPSSMSTMMQLARNVWIARGTLQSISEPPFDATRVERKDYQEESQKNCKLHNNKAKVISLGRKTKDGRFCFHFIS